MPMTTHIVGVCPFDDDYLKKTKAYWACKAAGCSIPDDFQGASPDKESLEVNIDEAITTYQKDRQEGYEVEIAKLPKNVKTIRVYW